MNQNFCILPWLHLHSYPKGKTYLCCEYDVGALAIGDVTVQTLDEIATSGSLNQIRADMLNDRTVFGCNKCQSIEKSGGTSSRLRYNEMFRDSIPEYIRQTNADGSITYDFKLKIMNIRYSNLCNFACRSCGPDCSSLWGQENKIKFPVQVITDAIPTYMEEIYQHLPHVRKINFAGGESALIDEHWQILDRLVEINRADVEILWVTNLSKISHKRKNIIDYIKFFKKNFTVMASIDASHKRGEIYRHGTVWTTIENNLRILKEANTKLAVNCTVGAINAWHAPDLQRYLLESGLLDAKSTFNVGILVHGTHLSTKVLPVDYKQAIQQKIIDHMAWLKSQNHDIEKWQQVIDFMNSEDHTHLLPEFVKETLRLDSIRGQKTSAVFPELKNILVSG